MFSVAVMTFKGRLRSSAVAQFNKLWPSVTDLLYFVSFREARYFRKVLYLYSSAIDSEISKIRPIFASRKRD